MRINLKVRNDGTYSVHRHRQRAAADLTAVSRTSPASEVVVRRRHSRQFCRASSGLPAGRHGHRAVLRRCFEPPLRRIPYPSDGRIRLHGYVRRYTVAMRRHAASSDPPSALLDRCIRRLKRLLHRYRHRIAVCYQGRTIAVRVFSRTIRDSCNRQRHRWLMVISRRHNNIGSHIAERDIPSVEHIAVVNDQCRRGSGRAVCDRLHQFAGCERSVFAQVESDRKHVNGERRTDSPRFIHRHYQFNIVSLDASIRIARPARKVVMLGRNSRNGKLVAIRLPARFRCGYGAVLCFGGLEPVVGSEDVPCEFKASRDRNREFVCNRRCSIARANIYELSVAQFINSRFRSRERHLFLIVILPRLAVHRHVELLTLPIGRHLDCARSAKRDGGGRPALEHPAVSLARRNKCDCILNRIGLGIRVRRPLQAGVGYGVRSHGEVCANRMRSRKWRKHIAVCHTNGSAIDQHIGNMVADIRYDHVFWRITAVISRVAHWCNCAMRSSRGGNDRFHRERNDRRGRLCAKHRHDRAVGTTHDEVVDSVAIRIAIAKAGTVGKRNIVREHREWRSTPCGTFSKERPHVTGRAARNNVGKAIMVDVGHNRRGASVRNGQCRSIHNRKNRHAVRASRRITRNDADAPIHAASDKFVTAVAIYVVGIRHGTSSSKRGNCSAAWIFQHVTAGYANVGFRNAVAVHVGECQGRSLTALRRNLDVHTLRLEIRPGSCEL